MLSKTCYREIYIVIETRSAVTNSPSSFSINCCFPIIIIYQYIVNLIFIPAIIVKHMKIIFFSQEAPVIFSRKCVPQRFIEVSWTFEHCLKSLRVICELFYCAIAINFFFFKIRLDPQKASFKMSSFKWIHSP